MLILAGVTIAMLVGDNGILTKTTEAKNDQADATVKEAIALLWNEYQLEIKSSSNEGVFEDVVIEYESGMTWREWIESAYNEEVLELATDNDGDYIDLSRKLKDKAGYEWFRLDKEELSKIKEEVLPDDLIDSNLMYSIVALPS